MNNVQVNQLVAVDGVTPLRTSMNMPSSFSGGGHERELMQWYPQSQSADVALLPNLNQLNNKAIDVTRNHGYARGGVQIHIDNIVGHQFKLSAKPDGVILGVDPDELAKWAKKVERHFTTWAESPECNIDAERKRTFTMMIREAVGTHVTTGEIIAAAEWIKNRPMSTAIKMIHNERLCNPYSLTDNKNLRAGVELGKHGEAIAYHIRTAHESDGRYGVNTATWKRVLRQTKWGRAQLIHIFEPRQADQNRGINDFASILGDTKMLQKFENTTLQNAIVNAMYAAVIETDVDSETAFQVIGEGDNTEFTKYLQTKAAYAEGANIKYDGVRIPHLFPGEKLNLLTANQPGQDFAAFESSILRNIAAGLNVSYEQLSRDYSKTNYSSARASMLESWRFFMGRRAVIAKRFASTIYALWMEEAIDKGIIKLPKGAPSFYESKDAWTKCDWIGAGRPQIDGLKETKELVLKLEAGLITYEKACALLGEDYQEMFDQQVREMKERDDAKLPKASWAQAEKIAPDAMVESPETNR